MSDRGVIVGQYYTKASVTLPLSALHYAALGLLGARTVHVGVHTVVNE